MGRIDPKDQNIAIEGTALGYEHNEVRKILDMLRKSRAARGGVGAPLKAPAHLRDAAAGIGVVITDADLNPNKPEGKVERYDRLSDTARRINEAEKEQQG